MFDRPSGKERTLLVHLQSANELRDAGEPNELAVSAGAMPVGAVTARCDHPDPRYLVGKGKVEELRNLASRLEAGLVHRALAEAPVLVFLPAAARAGEEEVVCGRRAGD